MKISPPSRGVEISKLTFLRTIGLPLVLVMVDIGSDGNMCYFMSDYIGNLRGTTTLTSNNLTNQNNPSTNALHVQGKDELTGLFITSVCILVFSMLNLIFQKPAKTLIRSAQTCALMESRELESKDVPLPIGDLREKKMRKSYVDISMMINNDALSK